MEDERINRITLSDALAAQGFDVVAFESAEDADHSLEHEDYDFAVLDLKLPGMDGLHFLQRLRQKQPECEAIMVTAYGTIEKAVEAMKLGAYDFVTKPFSPDELVFRLKRSEEHRRLRAQVRQLQEQLEDRYSFHALLGKSRSMQVVFQNIERVSQSSSSVMILGESGTGKELTARAIHYSGPRKKKPFVAVSCAAIPENLIESELFGFKAGAFTDAKKDKSGKAELADGGTLFLDDVDATPLSIQPKLLRLLQEKEVERLGSNQPRKVDIRVIASAKPDLEERVKKNEFREDLYYRLCVVKILLPPLRERQEDVPLLCEHFLRRYAPGVNPAVKRLSKEAMERLRRYSFPGNVRQLEHVIEHALHFAKGEEIQPEDLPAEIGLASRSTSALPPLDENFSLPELEEEIERRYFREAMQKVNGNISEAARLLKIPRSTLQDKLRKMNIEVSEGEVA